MESLVTIGKVLKPHGINGEIKFAVEEVYWEDFEGAQVVFIKQKGQPIPFFIEAVRGEGMTIVKLEGITTREMALPLSQCELLMRESDLLSDDEREVPREAYDAEFAPLIGFTITDELMGTIGEILEIETFPQQELARVLYQGQEIMIPLHEDLITGVDEQTRILQMDLPEGLLDMQLNPGG